MRPHFRVVLGSFVGLGVLMVFILGFHLGGQGLLQVGIYFPLSGAFLGGTLVLFSVNSRRGREESGEPWLRRERLSWMLIGCGCLAWGIGECFWRYYVARGQSPFPSLADLGYVNFSPLVFAGLILQPFSASNARKRVFLLLDSLIAMGALLSIAWFLLLGSLAQTPAESLLAKILGLYYPTSDVALLSYTIFLLLRGNDPVYQVTARRISLLVVGLGLSVYATSDFLFNVLQNIGLPVDGGWLDLGWPLGMMAVGAAAYLRSFLPGEIKDSAAEKQKKWHTRPTGIGSSQILPYLLLLLLFLVLTINVLSTYKVQQDIRPILVIATLIVVGLVVARQLVTIRENERLMREQTTTHEQLELLYQEIAKRKSELEAGVTHLKAVQTLLANGDMRARARIMSGDLWPLATGLNLMADRMMRSEQRQKYAQKSIVAIEELSQALEQRHSDKRPFVLPASCFDATPELHHLLLVMGLVPTLGSSSFKYSRGEYSKGGERHE